ncbi:MAG: nucleoside 2-deoxyribosyltransferase domain-containing protein, partial [Nitrospiraceae bacterium]
ENWQDRLSVALAGYPGTILNPRRDDWDSSWIQSADNPKFREQVEWELDGLEQADIIAVYFDPETKSPITLFELGLFLGNKIIVLCPEGFWRKGNIDLVCERYKIEQAKDWLDFVGKIRGKVE